MAVTADIQPTTRPRLAAALLISADVAEGVTEALTIGGYRLTPAAASGPGQVPRFLVQAADRYVRAGELDLTAREMDVLARIARGQSNPQIAADMVLAVDTVKSHLRRIFRKLQVNDRAHAVAVGYQRGLLGQAAA